MFNLCRVNKARVRKAAEAGIIPHLKHFVRINSQLKQFALPILCDMALAGEICRKLLWENDGLSLYLSLLNDQYWQANAMEAIRAWLDNDKSSVEPILVQPENSAIFLGAFLSAQANSFEGILVPLYHILVASSRLAKAMAKPQFFDRLQQRLAHKKPIVRKNLLQIVHIVCDADSSDLRRNGLYDVIEKLSREDQSMLVRELAKDHLGHFNTSRRVSQPPLPVIRDDDDDDDDDDEDDDNENKEDDEQGTVIHIAS
jgi:hypothetical protein